jgi:hypothetical protein
MRLTTGGTPYAIGTPRRRGFRVRRIMFGKLAASMERRDGEQIRAVKLIVADKASRPEAQR